MKRPCVLIAIAVLVLLFVSGICFAGEKEIKLFQGVEVLTGYAQSELEEKGAYDSVPLFVDLDFNLKRIFGKSDFYPPGMLQFQIEPFLFGVYEPKANIETGTSIFLKLGIFPESWALQPYVKVGGGFSFMTTHAAEQSTQLNYIETYVVGTNYYLTQNTALTLEGRFRHMSNGGRKLPNHGINTDLYLAGISYRF